jgi:hypothetical protein
MRVVVCEEKVRCHGRVVGSCGLCVLASVFDLLES